MAFRNDKKSKSLFFLSLLYFTFMELLLIGIFIDDETKEKWKRNEGMHETN